MLYITGITGHTGTWLLKRLIAENYQGPIKCVLRKNSDTTLIDQSKLNIEKVYGDLDDMNFLMESMKNVKTIVHISWIMHSPKIVEAAIANNVNWAILVHTTGRFSKYKSASEEYIKIEESLLTLKDKMKIKAVGKKSNYETLKSLINDVDLLINATPVGMYPVVNKTPISKDLLAEHLFVYDIIYNPLNTQLLKDASEIGCKTLNGIEMFINQGALAFEWWTGTKPNTNTMKKTIIEILETK